MRIEELREEIDAIDAELLRLINRRAGVAVRVGALKHAKGVPLRDPDRERDVLARARRANRGPLGDAAVSNIFRLIIDESRCVEATAVSCAAGKVRELA